MTEAAYFVAPRDWPVGPEPELTVDQTNSVLDQFDQFYQTAVDSLGRTRIPRADEPKVRPNR